MESRRQLAEGGGAGGSSKRPPEDAGRTTTQQQVKVKHIVTTEVSTDEASFKDVVQSLTGKDSGAARAAAVVAGRASWRSNVDAASAGGGAAGVVSHNKGVVGYCQETEEAGVLPSEEEMRWFWRGA